MNTPEFLRHLADAIDAGLPDPIAINVPFGGFTGSIQVKPRHVAAWTRHLGITHATWAPDGDSEYLRTGPAPRTGIHVVSVRPVRRLAVLSS